MSGPNPVPRPVVKPKANDASDIEKFAAWAMLGFVMLGVMFAIPQILKIRTEYSLSQFLPKNHPLLTNDENIQKKFYLKRHQPLIVLVQVDQGHWLTMDRLKSLRDATTEIGQLTGITDATSLATLQGGIQSEGQLEISSILAITNDSTRYQRVLQDRMMVPAWISKDLRQTIIIANVPETASNDSVHFVTDRMRSIVKSKVPDATVSVGGVPAVQVQLAELVKSELARLMLLGLLASCLTLGLIFSNPAPALVAFAAITITNIVVLATCAFLNIPLTVLAVTIPILVSVNVLSLSTHTMLRFSEEITLRPLGRMGKLSGRMRLVIKTIQSLFLPNLLTSTTTGIGFATLILVEAPMIRDFAIVVSISMMISWLTTNLIMIPLFVLLPIPQSRKWVLGRAAWVEMVFAAKEPIVIASICFSILLGLVGRNLNWSARLFDDLPEGKEARTTTEKVDRELGGMVPLDLLITKDRENEPWNDPRNLMLLDQLADEIRRFSVVGSVTSPPDLLRELTGEPRGPIPKTRQAVAESFFLFGMSEANPVKMFITGDGKTARLAVRLEDRPSAEIHKTVAAIEARAQQIFKNATISSGGMSTTIYHLNEQLARSLVEGFWHALGAIFVLLLFVFRSFRWTLVAALPNLIPAAVLIGILAVTKTPLKPGVALVFSIALGFAFDNTIYLLQRLKAIMKEKPNSTAKEIEQTLRLEGNPCLVSTMCLLSGFAVFMMSEFEINRNFGGYMLIALLAGLVGDLVFMPALIRWFPGLLNFVAPAKITDLRQVKGRLQPPPASQYQLALQQAAAAASVDPSPSQAESPERKAS